MAFGIEHFSPFAGLWSAADTASSGTRTATATSAASSRLDTGLGGACSARLTQMETVMADSSDHPGVRAAPRPLAAAIKVTSAPSNPRPAACSRFGLLFCMGQGPNTQVELTAADPITERSEPAEVSVEVAQEQLTQAVVRGDVAELHEALRAAEQAGLQGHEVRRAKDALLAVEASDVRKRVELGVEEAIESDDWWKLQASVQMVVGSGFGDSEMAAQLREAMRTHRRRQEVARDIRAAAAARDAQRLRTAIEAALLAHAREPEVRRAREALRALQTRRLAKEALQRAVEGGPSSDREALQGALDAARAAKLEERPPAPLGPDPEEAEALAAARSALRGQTLDRLEELHAAGDLDGLSAALAATDEWPLPAEDVERFEGLLERLRAEESCRDELASALADGSPDALLAAIAAAEAAGLGGPAGSGARGHDAGAALLDEARHALADRQRREQRVLSQRLVVDRLRHLTFGDDPRALAEALSDAETAGISDGADAAKARECLRSMRARSGAAQDLRDAVQSGSVYQLRAMLASARGMGVAEAEVAAAQAALRVAEAKMRTRRGVNTALASSNPDLLRSAAAEAKRFGLGRREGALAEAGLRSLAQEQALEELREVLTAAPFDTERLRAALQTAADVGAQGPEVLSASERWRSLESQAWLRQQLRAAAASGDAVKIRAAVKQVEVASASASKEARQGEARLLDADLAAARDALRACSAREHARQELRLARIASNPTALAAAVRQAEEAALPKEEYEADLLACRDARKPCPPSPTSPASRVEAGVGQPPPRAKPCGGGRQPTPPPKRQPSEQAEVLPTLLSTSARRSRSRLREEGEGDEPAEADAEKGARRVHWADTLE